jgi:DNA-binding NarL/FixJ family response regulator
LNARTINSKGTSVSSGVSQRRRVFIVDDHPLVREWLAGIIRQQSDLLFCGAAPDGATALASMTAAKPDVVIVDLSLEGNSGLDLIKDLQVQFPGIKTLVLSMHDQMAYAERVLRAGARGYIMKSESSSRVVEAIRQVLAGKIYANEALMAQLMEKLAHGGAAKPDSPAKALSDRELHVFRRLGQGMKTREIAEELRISIKTVQVYCARIKEKLGLANASALMREAVLWVDVEKHF